MQTKAEAHRCRQKRLHTAADTSADVVLDATASRRPSSGQTSTRLPPTLRWSSRAAAKRGPGSAPTDGLPASPATSPGWSHQVNLSHPPMCMLTLHTPRTQFIWCVRGGLAPRQMRKIYSVMPPDTSVGKGVRRNNNQKSDNPFHRERNQNGPLCATSGNTKFKKQIISTPLATHKMQEKQKMSTPCERKLSLVTRVHK